MSRYNSPDNGTRLPNDLTDKAVDLGSKGH